MLRYLGTIVATAIVVLFLLVSALPLMHWFRAEARTAMLDESRSLWAGLGLDDYAFVLEMECDCEGVPAGAVRVSVRADQPLMAEAPPGGERIPLPVAPAFPATVDAMFDAIATLIDEAPAVLDVSYDENYGLPREIYVDPDTDVPGDETRIRVTAFDPRAAADEPA